MKKIFTLCVATISATFLNAQVVLNEIYTDPGAGHSEFFEFYNTSTNPVPENMDNYTIVAYYEDAGKTGFYVLDLPNLSVGPKGYFVGAASSPFNIQSQSNVVANFSWNAIPAGGSISNWQRSGASYTQVALPSSFTDLFFSRSGTGAVNHVLVFKNGLLVNGVFTGTNKAVIPSYIESMPPLFVDMIGSSIDFIINFNSYNDNQFEYVTATAGNDNGYIRLNDGKCGVWDKSSAAAQHTPGQTNGSAVGLTGDLTIFSYITELGGDNTKALLVYNVTSSSLAAFPVTMETYYDKGIIGQLDGFDSLLDSRILYTVADGDQYVILPERQMSVIIVAKTPSGCFDAVLAVDNNLAPLPVHLLKFQGNLNKNNKVTLNWTVADNETVNSFEVQRSYNGRDFATIGIVFASEKRGTENYMFYETVTNSDRIMYRLKMIDKGNDIDYSKILVFMPKTAITSEIRIYGNPVKDKLTFSYYSNANQKVSIKIYDMAGKLLMNQDVQSADGNNLLSQPLNSNLKTGLYILEVSNGAGRQVAKFTKQ